MRLAMSCNYVGSAAAARRSERRMLPRHAWSLTNGSAAWLIRAESREEEGCGGDEACGAKEKRGLDGASKGRSRQGVRSVPRFEVRPKPGRRTEMIRRPTLEAFSTTASFRALYRVTTRSTVVTEYGVPACGSLSAWPGLSCPPGQRYFEQSTCLPIVALPNTKNAVPSYCLAHLGL